MANITRIKNNQITDANVVAYAKMTPGTITGNLISPTLTMNSNVTIIGNLNVTGNSATINSVNTYIADPIVTFNAGYINSITNYEIGMLINRNLNSLGPYGAVNTAWVWVENDQAFEAITTATTGNALTNLTSSGFANAKLGNTTVVSLVVNNNLTAGEITATPISGSTGYFTTLYGTNFSTANAQISGGSITGTPINGSSGSFTSLHATDFATGNAVISGGYISALSNASIITGVISNFSSGNAQITGGSLTGITNFGAATLQANNFSTGNAVISGGYLTGLANVYATLGQFTDISSGNVLFTGGAITGLTNFTATTAQATNFSSGNAVISGGYISALANATVTTGVVTNFSSGNAVISGGYITVANVNAGPVNSTYLTASSGFSTANAVISGGSVNGTPIGNTTASTGAFTTLTNSGVHTSNGNLVAASGTASTNTTSGALVVVGGAGVSGDVRAGAVYDAGSRVVSTSSGAGNLTITGNSISLALTGNGPVNAGNALSIPTIVTDAYGRVVSLTSNTITQTWTLNGTNGTTGVTDGTTLTFAGTYGVTVEVGNEYANIGTPQDLRSTASPTFSGLYVPGTINALTVNAPTIGNVGTTLTATSSTIGTEVVTNLSTGNAQITGGAISATPISGSTGYFATAQATNFSSGNAVITGGYASGLANVYATTAQFTNFSTGNAVVSGGYISALANATVTTGVVTNFSTANAVITGGSVNATPIGAVTPNTGAFTTLSATGIATVSNSTASTSTSTGALVVTGGAGIGGDVWIGGNLNVLGIGSVTTVNREIILTTEVVAGNLVANSGIASTNTTTGAIVVQGGVGISGDVNVGANISVTNNLFATNFNTANAQITGGAISATPISGSTGYFTTAQATNFSSSNVLVTGGAINSTPIGATTPSTGKFTDLTATNVTTMNGNLVAASTTINNGFNTNTGALVVVGGAGISGNLTVGGNVAVQGNINITSNVYAITFTSNTGVFFGNAAGFGALYAGIPNGYVYQPQTVFQNSTDFNGYAQVNHQNISNGAKASTDYVATANNGTSDDTYINFGINSSGFTATATQGPNDGYLYVHGNTTTNGGNLLLASVHNDIVFATNGSDINSVTEYGRIKSSDNAFVVMSTTAATNTTSGALQIAGGVGVQGAVYAGSIQNTPIGSTTASSGAFTTLSSTGATTLATTVASNFSTANAVITGGYVSGLANLATTGTIIASGNIVAASGTQSTSVTSGALVVLGGVGIGSNVAVGGNIILNNSIGVPGQVITATASGSQWVTPLFYTIYNGTSNVNIATPGGAVTVGVNSANVATFTTSGLVVNNNVYVNGSSLNTTSGNLYIAGPNGGSMTVSGIGVGNAFVTAGTFIAQSTTPSVDIGSGALIVSGGAGIVGNLNASNISGPIGNYGTNTGKFTTVTVTNGITVSGGNIVAGAETASTSSTTGALVVTGGAGIGGNLNVTGNASLVGVLTSIGNAQITGNATITNNLQVDGTSRINGVQIVAANIVAAGGSATNDNTTGAIVVTHGGIAVAGNVNIKEQLFVGVGAQTSQLNNADVVFRGTSGVGPSVQFTQAAIINTTNSGSSDWVAYADNFPGEENDHGWADLGFTGSQYDDPTYTITKPNDAYLFGSAADSSFGGNLVLATDYSGYQNDILFATGGFVTESEVARFSGNASTNGKFILKLPTNAIPAANTGAFQVWGGESISGNSYVGGAMTINGSQGSGYDFIVKGKTNNTLIWARPNTSYDQVVIGGSATPSSLVSGAKLQINSTDSMLMPVGTQAQRPGTPVAGMVRYSSTANAMEFYNGTIWQSLITEFTIITDQQFNGDGSTVAFALSSTQTTASCIVSINGVVQIPTLAYSVSGTTLTFTEAPAAGDVIDVRELTTTVTPIGIYDATTYNGVQTSGDGVTVTTGTAGANNVTGWTTTGARVNYNANVTVATSGSAVTIDSFFANTYSSAEYTVTGTISGTRIRQISKLIVVTDGTSVNINQFGTAATSGNTLVTFGATVSSGSVNLTANGSNANMIYRIDKLYQSV